MTAFFACASGLASALDPGLLGAYDGTGAWQVYVSALGGREEQLFVEMHEGMHHELQSSTGWGLVSAMASELARRGYRADALRAVFEHMVEPSRSAHEMFATAISSFVIGEDRARELLLGNVLYSDHLREARALVPSTQAPSREFHHAAVTAVLRAVMSPTSALRLLDVGYDRLRHEDVDGEANTPQARLDAYRASPAATGWEPLLSRLAAEHPEHVDDFWRDRPEDERDEDAPAFRARRAFDEEVLLPACYRHVEEALDDAGLPTIRFGAQAELASRVKRAVGLVDPELAGRLRLVTERRPVADDGLQYDRQQLVLRAPLPAAVLPYSGGPADREFLTWAGRNGPTMLGIWVSAAAAQKQWRFEPADAEALPRTVRALVQLGTDRDTAEPLVLLATLPPSGPSAVQRSIGESIPLVVITTHSSLVDPELAAELGSVEPVFVLMDLPVAHHVGSWIAQGLDVRMAASPLTGTVADLWILVFAISEAPGFVFLSLGGTTAVSLLIERLRRAHGDDLHIDAEVLRSRSGGIDLAVAKILAAWHVLDQDGTETHRGLDAG